MAEPKTDDRTRDDMPQTEEEWRERLTPDQYRVLRQAGTERAFTGTYYDHKAEGLYTCAACGTPLFSSEAKYDSGSGWPSFDSAVDKGNVKLYRDTTHGMERVEVRCATCDSHLGHVFNDGPRQTTGQRYCINSVSLDFDPKGEGAS